MSKKSKLCKLSRITVVAAAVAVSGSLLSFPAFAEESSVTVEKPQLTLPGAGMGGVIEDYVGTTSGSSVELLSTTALASSLGEDYNEYYDENGEVLAKLIVYKGKKPTKVYKSQPGTARVEEGKKDGKAIGTLSFGAVATLVSEQGDWYQIFSDSLNGFVKKTDFAKGVKAEKLDKKTYVANAYVKADDSWLYEDATEDSAVTCVLPKKIPFEVIELGDEFSKIAVNGVGEGWVRNDNIKVVKERRFGTTFAKLKAQNKKIKAGILAAAAIEDGRAEERDAEEEKANEENGGENENNDAGNNDDSNTSGGSNGGTNIKPPKPDSKDTAALREAIANYAQQFVGVLPYVWGSSDLNYGADCSGFTSAIYRAYGIEISRSSDAQTWEGTPVSRSDIRPGDIVGYPGHVGMYIGNGQIVHETTPGSTASIADIDVMPVINITRYIN